MKYISWLLIWVETGYIFTGENDASVMHNSAKININVLEACYKRSITNIFFILPRMYPSHNQKDPKNL